MFPTVAKPYLLLLRMDTPCLYSEATVACLFQGFLTGQWPPTLRTRQFFGCAQGYLYALSSRVWGPSGDHYPIWDTAGGDGERCICRLSSAGMQAVHTCF